MKYTIHMSPVHKNEEGEWDYDKIQHHPIYVSHISDVPEAMDLLGIQVWEVSRDSEVLWKSPLKTKIDRRNKSLDDSSTPL